MNPNPPQPNAPDKAAEPRGADPKAAELCRYFTLSDEGRAMLTPELMPGEFAEALTEAKRFPDAVQLIAHHLPKRQGVFWAMTCVRQSGDPLTAEGEAALKSAERWIADPSEDNRKATLKPAEAADTGTPAGSAALAAYYADGLPRTDDPKANARAYFMTAKLVSVSVMLAAMADPAQMQDRFAAFLAKGLEIVKRSKR